MKPEDVHLTDWKRLLLGDTPWLFLVEIAWRTVVAYAVMIVLLRVLGNHMSGPLTRLEMSVVLMLGALLVGAIQLPGQGLLIAVELMAAVLVIQRGLGLVEIAHPAFELASQGDAIPCVEDGVLRVDILRGASISREQIQGALRQQKVRQLGEVRRLYLEAYGEFSLFRQAEPRPGLCVLPAKDPEGRQRCRPSPGLAACASCGQVVPEEKAQARCERCDHHEWATAVL
jgi:uncharacterized membrane protein YcaP (DUF421 family)